MKTSEIISTQLKHLNSNSKEYFKICGPYIIFTFLIIVVFKNVTGYVSNILYLVDYLIGVLLVVNIHRLVILNEKNNYYSFDHRFSISLKYFFYSTIIIIFTYFPLGLAFLMVAFIDTLDLNSTFFFPLLIAYLILMFLFIIGLFIFYPRFALNLPIAAIGEKVHFFKMWNLSNGFKLTIFLQFIIINVVFYICILILFLFTRETFVFYLLWAIGVALSFALTISCLSKTYLLWKEKINN